jgi:hypothetical protein
MDTPRLKIRSKRLKSGRFQINFTTDDNIGYYGYLLAEPRTTVSDIIAKISRHIQAAHNSERYFQSNLFSLGKRKISRRRILIFKKQAHGKTQ